MTDVTATKRTFRPHWSAPFIGLSYRDHGRDAAGVDCWGLVVIVYREVLGIDLPGYDEGYVTTEERHQIAALIDGHRQSWPWTRQEEPAAFDIALFRRGRHTSHVGIVVASGRMLHIPCDGDRSRVEDWRCGHWMPRLIGFYRHAEAASKRA